LNEFLLVGKRLFGELFQTFGVESGGFNRLDKRLWNYGTFWCIAGTMNWWGMELGIERKVEDLA
jgi:hypothetical protein